MAEEADFVIVGAGTAGLVLANRLSEDPSVTVLVVETGSEIRDELLADVNQYLQLTGPEHAWQYKSTPQPLSEDRVFELPQGNCLGGSATINAAYYLPPSRASIDCWAQKGNPQWSYDELLPYIKKAQTFHPADPETRKAFEIDQPDHAVPQSTGGPIQVSCPEFAPQHPVLKAWNKLIKELGYNISSDLILESPVGGCCLTLAVDPRTGKRSAANTVHGGPAFARPNVKLLSKTCVQKIRFEGKAPDLIAKTIEVSTDGQAAVSITAKKEVLLCAGAHGSPKILELSGIGQRAILDSCGIPTLIDAPGVGEDLQCHNSVAVLVQTREGVAAGEGMRGIFYIPLRQCAGLEDKAARKDFFDQLRPTDPKQQVHFDLVRDMLDRQDQATCYAHIMGISPDAAVLAFMRTTPFSVGRSHIASKDPSELPQIDLAAFSQPADLDVTAHTLLVMFQLLENPLLTPFFKPLEGEARLKDLDAAREYVRKHGLMTYHSSGTAAMMPQNKGGVVDQDLLVYGTRNLRVADISMFPVLPQGNPMPAVYAVAERAADIIKAHYR